jgi:hypothetical protein
MSDLEKLWSDLFVAQQQWKQLIAKLPSTPADFINASPEKQIEMLDTDELEEVQAKITETLAAIKNFKVS